VGKLGSGRRRTSSPRRMLPLVASSTAAAAAAWQEKELTNAAPALGKGMDCAAVGSSAVRGLG
jgi:hypothetical protein